MSKLKLNITMSIDGFVAGPDQSREHPLGVGGEELHDWLVPLKAFRESHGEEGGEVNASTPFAEDILGGAGATIMGRNMFGGGPGPWDKTAVWQRSWRLRSWKGWWGDNPPFHHPVFVLTSHPRERLEMQGGTTFSFTRFKPRHSPTSSMVGFLRTRTPRQMKTGTSSTPTHRPRPTGSGSRMIHCGMPKISMLVSPIA